MDVGAVNTDKSVLLPVEVDDDVSLTVHLPSDKGLVTFSALVDSVDGHGVLQRFLEESAVGASQFFGLLQLFCLESSETFLFDHLLESVVIEHEGVGLGAGRDVDASLALWTGKEPESDSTGVPPSFHGYEETLVVEGVVADRFDDWTSV